MSILTKKITKNNLKSDYLLSFKTHLGSRSPFRNRDLDEYVFGFDTLSTTIFNLDKTLVCLKRALQFLTLLKQANKPILFVGTSLKARKITKYVALATEQPYVDRRWVKGSLTNWETISSSIKFYQLFLKKLNLTKKASSSLQQTYGGLDKLTELPAAIFIIDLDTDYLVAEEASKLNIPVISIIDNNSMLIKKVDYPILSNTSSVLPLFFIISLVLKALKK